MFLSERKFLFTRNFQLNWLKIRDEAQKIPLSAYLPWPEKYLYGNGWKVFGIIAFGKLVETSKVCPVTTKLVGRIPNVYTAGFSLLQGKTHIKAHRGNTSGILRCHLGLIIPDNCKLRVGDQTRSWREGRWLFFDDTNEHEAFNNSKHDRIILLIDLKTRG